MTHTDLTSRRLQLLGSGYFIIPNVAKIPAVAGWNDQGWITREMKPARIEGWPSRFPGAESTGVLLRGGLGALDIDVDDPLAWHLLDEIATLAPDLFQRAPTRFGASEYKVALFFRVEGAPWVRLASRRYGGHQVEIFGGETLKGGKTSRQFGVDGPHSYNADRSVKAYYQWALGTLGLAAVPLGELPTLSREQALEILGAFERLAEAAGWAPDAGPDSGDSQVVYDIDEATRFNTNRGGSNIDYAGLCAEYDAYGAGLRCSADFMPGRGDSGSRDRCLIGDNNRHQCVAVWVPGDEAIHFPAALKPPELKPEETIDDVLPPAGSKKEDYFAFLPTHKYIYRYTNRIYPIETIDRTLNKVTIGTKPKKQTKQQIKDGEEPELVDVQIPASLWLDRHRPIMEMSWAPGEGELICGRLPTEGGWIARADVTTFNLYKPPAVVSGNSANAGRWVEFIQEVYPDHVDHIIGFFAHRIQKPAEKINHALMLTGAPGIGKDTLLEPLKYGVGPWNFKEATPRNIMERNNDYVRGTVLRISELHDLGDVNRYAFYEAIKILAAAPPDMLRVNAKYIPEHYVANVTAVIGTTNYPFDAMYLPLDDRRHYICGTELTRSDAWDAHCIDTWKWYAGGGINDVITYLAEYDLSAFDAKRPPLKTAAFWRMVDANVPSEIPELQDAIDHLGAPGKPPAAFTKNMVASAVTTQLLRDWVKESKNARNFTRRMNECGYMPVRCANREDGLWRIDGRRLMIYALIALLPADRYAAAEKLRADEENRIISQKGNIVPFKPV